MSVLSVQADIRAAVRAWLLGCTIPTVSFTTNVTLSGQTISAPTEPALDFTTLFKAGEYATVSGFSTANNGLYRVMKVAARVLTLDATFGTQTVSFGTVAVLLPEPAWEGLPFEPNKSRPFMAEVFRNTGSQVRALGRGGTIQHNFLATVTLFWPSGKGTLGLESMAGRLLERFRPGTPLSYGANAGTVVNATSRPLLQEPEWISCPVIASVTAWTAN